MAITLEQLQKHIETRASQPDLTKLQNIATVLFNEASADFLAQFEVDQLGGITEGVFRLLDKKRPGEVTVRVYNPELEVDGWETDHTALEVALGDRPFIVDSIRACLRSNRAKLSHFLHPIFSIKRDPEGNLSEVFLQHSDTSSTLAYELFLIETIEEPAELRKLRERIKRVLGDVVAATTDFSRMKAKSREIAGEFRRYRSLSKQMDLPESSETLDEYEEFMTWLGKNNYVYLGYREYELFDEKGPGKIQVKRGSGLGILRNEHESRFSKPVPIDSLPEEVRSTVLSFPLLIVTKTSRESTVHRAARMDYIGIKSLDAQGRVIGEKRFQGLFTLQAFSTSANEIPILRKKLQRVLRLDRAHAGSHDFKQIIKIFNSIPLGDLFWLSAEELQRDIRTTMTIEQEQGVRLMIRLDPLLRGFAVIVVMPRERFNSIVRQRIQDYLYEELRASHVDYQLAMVGDDQSQVRFHFFYSSTLSYDEIDISTLDTHVAELTRSWDERLIEGLAQSMGDLGEKLARRYLTIFSDGFKAEVPVEEALLDIRNLESLGDKPLRIDLLNSHLRSFPEETTFLRIYHRYGTLELNRVFPVLENLGLRVIEQISYQLKGVDPAKELSSGIDIFRVQDESCKKLRIGQYGDRLKEAVLSVLSKTVRNDPLNRLVLTAGLTIRQIALLQAYRAHVFQVLPTTSLSFITSTLLAYPDSAQALCRIFQSLFDPQLSGNRPERMTETLADFSLSLDKVSSLPKDQLLQFFRSLIRKTVRTNFYEAKPYISLKVESRLLDGIPDPKPFCEIFVYSPELEAVHLRGGRVARGGLRWSDRPDDFRTEVLGLMKTQMTKNSVIVPVGSKGGFVLKQPPAEPGEMGQYVEQQYKTFIRGLLDLTDNIVDGQVTHPERLVIHDGYDPYLVVAADKGTATFSDAANSISKEYNFWLGDAFASGGSHGYDHKKEGITARGAWECVSRHFLELGLDVENQEFTVVGIGDMSGDVFGNGMLYTDKICLLAAFNHRHIFLDPHPDSRKSYHERKRLFQNPQLSWADYDRAVISEGGGIFPRHAKLIALTPQLREMLAIEEDALSGQDLVRAILKMKVDLFWNGGIGTYVKASSERNSEVGDPSNDPVRIDAPELGARVVGEGGNLGLTQLARIEYSLAGGRINTDAIDNSAGVDMSDHEVNIKILLQTAQEAGRLTFDERNQLLLKMTDDVSRLVLSNNYAQSLCLSLAERSSVSELDLFESLLVELIGQAHLKPSVESLPGLKLLQERRRHNQGLTRPELAVLLGYTKMRLQRDLLKTGLPDEPALQHYLQEYFPAILEDRFRQLFTAHPLKREIVATLLTNRLVDRLGLSLVHQVALDTGASPAEVLRAVLVTQEVLNLGSLFDEIFDLHKTVPIEAHYAALSEIRKTVREIAEWMVHGDVDLEDLSALIQNYRAPLTKLRSDLEKLLPARSERKKYHRRRKLALSQGFSKPLAHTLATLDYLPSCLGVVDVSRLTGSTLETAAIHFYKIGEALALGWLRDELGKIHVASRWEAVALTGLVTDLRRGQQQLTVQLLRRCGGGPIQVNEMLNSESRLMERYQSTLSEVKAKGKVNLAAGSVLARVLLQLLRTVGQNHSLH